MSTRSVVVTGAAGGIGRAVVERLAADDTAVIASDRPGTDLTGLDGLPGTVIAHEADITDEDQVRALFDRARQHGPVTQVAHVAGAFSLRPFARTGLEEFERLQRINATGTFLVLRETARALTAHRADNRAFAVVSSNAARVPRVGMAAYGASKAAVSALATTLALELAPEGVRGNVVCPGSTDTAMQRGMWGADPDGGRRAVIDGDPTRFRLGIPLARIAEPGDVAETVAFLLSPGARHLTLQEVFVDGGASLRT